MTPWQDDWVTRPPLDAIGRSAVGGAVSGLVMIALVAARMNPPAAGIADRYSTLAAILVAATVLTMLLMSARRLDRPERLAAVVILVATGMSWYSGRLWVHEKYFDYLVAQQKFALQVGGIELAGDIENFLRTRAHGAPPRPQPATWDRDEAAVFRYEEETASLFEAAFGPQLRTTHDMLLQRGLRDRDLDAFYRRPANAFQIDVIARRLAVLAHRLERS
jgi:hypothetical protein